MGRRRLTCVLVFGLAISWGWIDMSGAGAASPRQGTAADAMSPFQALVLGVVEGVTEYLPVSSTGHLLLAQRIMGIGGRTDAESPEARNRKEASDAYAICIQGGAIMAVLFLYARRVRGMALGVLGRDPAGRRLTVSVGLAFLPAAIVGLLLEGRIKSHLFGPWPVVGAWFAGGAVILWVASQMRRRPSRAGSALEAMAWPGAVLIGLIQCVAMWPGVSRSLATILGGLAAGLSLPAAVEFSFLLGVVTLGAATASDALRHGQAMLAAFDWTSMAVGFAAAFVSAVLAVRWMVGYLSRHGLGIFGYYRLAAALVTAALLLSGRL